VSQRIVKALAAASAYLIARRLRQAPLQRLRLGERNATQDRDHERAADEADLFAIAKLYLDV
jgi:hypothetical protein